MSRTLGQQRAEFTLRELVRVDSEDQDKFAKLTAGLPAMILQNGFGQALAFLMAKGKGKGHQGAAFDIMKKWLVNRDLLEDGSNKDFLLNISKMDQTKYLQAQTETLAMLEWLKRYANAELF